MGLGVSVGLVGWDWPRELFHWFLGAKRLEVLVTQYLTLVLPAGKAFKVDEEAVISTASFCRPSRGPGESPKKFLGTLGG